MVMPEVVKVEKRYMANLQYNPAHTMMNVVDFFDKVDKKNGGDGMVWVKATAKRGMHVIIELKGKSGERIKIPPIKPGDPICLSRYAQYEIIRDSADLVQNASNGTIKLMTQAEALDFFEKKAQVLKTTPEALMRKSATLAQESLRAKPMSAQEVDKSQRISNEPGPSIDDAINPYVQNLLAGVDVRLKDHERTAVTELMTELLNLEDSLTIEELDLIAATGYYPSVKKWAKAKHLELAKASGLIPTEDELSD